MGREERITRAVQSYDRELYCKRNGDGKLCIFRNSIRYEVYHLDDESHIISFRPTPYLVFTLTHNWRPQGTPVDWGIEPIMRHLKECDLWKRDIVTDLEKQEQKFEEKNERHRANETEAFLKDFRSQFAKTFKDTNVANLEKIDLRKKKEKSKWQL